MGKAKILITEDEFVVANDLRDSLKRMGYEVIGIAASGEKAIEKIKNKKPDLVLMDIILRGKMDGIEAAEKIKQLFDLPVVFLTAHADKHIVERAKATEPFAYLIKPAEDRQLETVIEMAMYKVYIEDCRKQMEKEMLKVLKKSGFSGNIGILGHIEDEDVELVLHGRARDERPIGLGDHQGHVSPRTSP